MSLLQIQNMTKTFGGLCAVSDFNISIEGNELMALIGPNGAGKTTVFNLVSGFYSPTEGSSSSRANPWPASSRIRSRPSG